ncbi:MAG: ABC transporter permease [Nitrospira sp.]|nr:ABC transporter permease [Nitrospira sp.]
MTTERPANRTSQVEQMLRAFRLNLTVLSWVGLLVGMFLIYNTMAFSVAQRRREIGIYRAIGMTQSRIAALFLMEAGLYGFFGGILGSGSRNDIGARADYTPGSNDLRSLCFGWNRREWPPLDGSVLEDCDRRNRDWMRGIHDRGHRSQLGREPYDNRASPRSR